MATRIFELARELGVTSKTMLEKCRAEGLDVKNHMATLSAGLEATLREWFSPDVTQTAVETSEHVDLEKARAKARKRRRHGDLAEAVEAPPAEAKVEPMEAPAAEPQTIEVAILEPGAPGAPAVAVAAMVEQAELQVAEPGAQIEAQAETAQPAQVAAEQVEATATEGFGPVRAEVAELEGSVPTLQQAVGRHQAGAFERAKVCRTVQQRQIAGRPGERPAGGTGEDD